MVFLFTDIVQVLFPYLGIMSFEGLAALLQSSLFQVLLEFSHEVLCELPCPLRRDEQHAQAQAYRGSDKSCNKHAGRTRGVCCAYEEQSYEYECETSELSEKSDCFHDNVFFMIMALNIRILGSLDSSDKTLPNSVKNEDR